MLNKNFLPITIVGLVFLFLIGRGCDSPKEKLDVSDAGKKLDVSSVGVGVSQRTTAVLDGEKLDLTADLDPAQVPEIVKLAYLEGAKLEKKDNELLTYVIKEVSNKTAGISTIDLNEDNSPDPILVVPEGDSERMTFSIRIPDPVKVTTYPDTPDEWQSIAENRAIEVLAVTVYPRLNNGQLERFDVEAKPNKQLYESSQSSYQSSFMSTLFTAYMINRLFFNPYMGFYGPGFYGHMGYANYGGRDVQSTRTTRTTYNKATPAATSMKTNSGQSVSSSLSSQKSDSVDKFKSTAIQKRETATAQKASGFGGTRPSSATSGSSSVSKPAASSSSSSWGRSSGSSSSSWGRSSGKSSSGGGGSRGGK